jgi:amino acid adenylation domain-containing protein
MSDRMGQTISEQSFFADNQIPHRQWLQGEVLRSQLSYWKQQIGDSPTTLELPTDCPRLAAQTFRGKIREFMLPSSLTESLKALSHNEEVTLFMTLLAAFQVLLHRYSCQDTIVIGSPIAGHNIVVREERIRSFENILPLRTDLSGNPSFRVLLGRVREVVLGAYDHQDLPFEQLVEELRPERNLSHSPLFQVMFALWNGSMPAQRLFSQTLSSLEIQNGRTKIDLDLVMDGSSHGLKGSFYYNADLFEDATIARMAGHLEILLSGIVANPDLRLSMLPLLTEQERHQMLVEWNDTRTDYPTDCCLHELFDAQAERTPDAIAVVFEDQQLTYRELNRRANQLAHYLRRLGVGPDVLVGICVERSLEMVVGLLGVLKAGGAYVPLDPAYPRERLAFMLEDAKVSVLLTQQRLVTGLIEDRRSKIEDCPSLSSILDPQLKVVCLDADWGTIAAQSGEGLASGVGAENLAYVIYTSGSTGRPKGAMNTHLGICNRLLWMQDAYQLTQVDRVLQKTPFSFDVSVWEFFWPLLTGACLVVARPGGHQDSAYLVKLIAEQKITTLHFVPAMLRVFLEEDVTVCGCVRRVICSGEALPLELQERFFARFDAELHNLYGPTEASVDVTFWACERENSQRIVPIGRPIANTQIYLLDQHQQPVPIGVPGELHIGGFGLARGYLNRSDLTAEVFIPNPFSQEPGARLYKTGDLARYLPDGNIEFLGRIDHQVKIRGFRIELEEIATALKRHPAVQQAVVLAREDESRNKRLIAYVVSDSGFRPTHTELRNFLVNLLPDYMVPAAFMLLDHIPLSPNGKVDGRALPAPDSTRPGLETAFAAPRTGLERLLCDMWTEILGIEQIGIHDNFFELGGSSIQGAVFINKLQEKFGEIVHIVAVFDAPTVADFAGYLNKHYPDAVLRIPGAELLHGIETTQDIAALSQTEKIDAFKAQRMRQLLRRRNAPR